jgi:hypothetical protein
MIIVIMLILIVVYYILERDSSNPQAATSGLRVFIPNPKESIYCLAPCSLRY